MQIEATGGHSALAEVSHWPGRYHAKDPVTHRGKRAQVVARPRKEAEQHLGRVPILPDRRKRVIWVQLPDISRIGPTFRSCG